MSLSSTHLSTYEDTIAFYEGTKFVQVKDTLFYSLNPNVKLLQNCDSF